MCCVYRWILVGHSVTVYTHTERDAARRLYQKLVYTFQQPLIIRVFFFDFFTTLSGRQQRYHRIRFLFFPSQTFFSLKASDASVMRRRNNGGKYDFLLSRVWNKNTARRIPSLLEEMRNLFTRILCLYNTKSKSNRISTCRF